jgi:hypothetical protein
MCGVNMINNKQKREKDITLNRIKELARRAATLQYPEKHIREASDNYFPNRKKAKS